MLNTNPESKFLAEGLTFDDVLVVPAHSEVEPRQIDISSYLIKNIKLNIFTTF